LPSAGEYEALLAESRADPGESTALVKAYSSAVRAEQSNTGERSALAALRGFTLG